MSGSGRHALTGCPGLVKIPSWKSGRLSWMSGSGQEALLDVRKLSGGPPGCARGPPGCPGVVGRPSRMFGRPSRMFGSGRVAPRMSVIGREVLPHFREWSGRPPAFS